jgi:hypothetical protein
MKGGTAVGRYGGKAVYALGIIAIGHGRAPRYVADLPPYRRSAVPPIHYG